MSSTSPLPESPQDPPTPAPPSAGAANAPTEKESGPVMQLIATGLQLWIRQQCESIESLDLQLEGSALQLLRGRLSGVRLMARRVRYQDLEIELVELRADPIRVAVGNVLKGQSVQLEDPFGIRGQVAFTAEGLSRSLSRPQWRSLGDWLGEQLLGLVPLVRLRIQQDRLVLAAQAVGQSGLLELETDLQAVGGTVEIRAVDSGIRARLPMDPNITIERANLEGGMVQLHGRAQVSP
ncbi:DUF2993 domain-containing protein [Synechococcus sp. CCY9201]|uniref:LmeA family phospholipid-binding protein n=2 Tax=Synechococcus TaxID=1129 RepID=UPI002AD4AEA5|nr:MULTISPECIES: DUF2993 domain-containing protein [unclassified Synechococcus]MEA5423904.1 DUF2993 domain-containing protein [Synechococcus sp. CCY9202]MEA5475269.1 DUF2993 domain-containing protein [Synechococcus sp. CCY9201]CAK6699446.1 hypothetical protein IFHNHDMJ_02637 [Synechococcus sp. CBW1107]